MCKKKSKKEEFELWTNGIKIHKGTRKECHIEYNKWLRQFTGEEYRIRSRVKIYLLKTNK